MSKNLVAVFAVTVAVAATPLACGDDEAPPDDGSGNSSGAGAAGGGGAGQSTGGFGGEATGGGKATSGGTSGRPGTGGSATGGASGSAGQGGASSAGEGGVSGATDGGEGGAPAGGEGGEGWQDESVERSRRICQKTEALDCDDYTTCVEYFRWVFFGAPHCGPVAEAALLCLDTRATIADFECVDGKPSPRWDGGASPLPFLNTCYNEFGAVQDASCY